MFPCHSQSKATAELVPAAKEGDLVTVQNCLTKKANIETQVVRFMCIHNVALNISFDLHP